MSNGTITTRPVNHIVSEQFGPEQGTGTLRFKRDALEIGNTKFQVYSPDDEREQHSDLCTWGTVIENISEYRASDGDHTCVTLHLDTNRGRHRPGGPVGITLDTLASAVEAAQRAAAGV